MKMLGREGRMNALKCGIIFIVISALLFYFGGGSFVWGDEYYPLKHLFIHSKAIIIDPTIVAFSINGVWYGIEAIPRFFSSELLQCFMIGAGIGAFFFSMKMFLFVITGIDDFDD